MEQFNNVFIWITTHKKEIIEIWGLVCLTASAIIKVLPPLPADSKLLPIVKFIGKFLALNRTVTDAERPK